MRQSQLFGTTRRETPKDEESKNAILLIRGGYINKTMAGVYSYLPLGLRVLHNLVRILREEMNRLPHTQEVLMPALQPRELWEESGRWEAAQEGMYTVDHEKVALGPTHEEIVTDLFRQNGSSYKDLPLGLYQIQNKFRRELRAKSGLLRGREFLMKDLYSFDLTAEGLNSYYEEVKKAYAAIFRRAGLKTVVTLASGGIFSKYSEEFQAITPSGEDTIYLNPAGDYARNQELVKAEDDPDLLEFSGGHLDKVQAIEVSNIFKLNDRISAPMQAQVSSQNGEKVTVWMGCYGIGISRLMGTIVEVLGDESGKIPWPKEIAPFQVHLLDLTPDQQGEKLYEELHSAGINILYDDRGDRMAGEKFADADLIGAPVRLVISKRSLESGGVEMSSGSEQSEIISLSEIGNRIG